jgi:hypothetical protein
LGVAEAHPFESEIGVADFASTCLWQVAGKCWAFSVVEVPRALPVGHPLKNVNENYKA